MAKGDWWDPQTYVSGASDIQKGAVELAANAFTGGASSILKNVVNAQGEIKRGLEKSTVEKKKDSEKNIIDQKAKGNTAVIVDDKGSITDITSNQAVAQRQQDAFNAEQKRQKDLVDYENRRFSRVRSLRRQQRNAAGAGLRSTILTGSLGLGGGAPAQGDLKTLLGQ